MRPNVTLDTNCIIALEENRPAASYVRELLELHRRDELSLRLVAIAASERKPDGTYSGNFQEFKQKLQMVDLQDLVLLKPLAYWGVAFYDWALYSSADKSTLERDIHEILFPNSPMDHEEFCKQLRVEVPDGLSTHPKWRNQKCDVLTMWGHIYHGGDIFVSSDKNFHKESKRERLMSLGAGKIAFPDDVLSLL